MAKAKGGATTTTKLVKKQISRPGVHSKNNTSTQKHSRNYKKAYRGQGR